MRLAMVIVLIPNLIASKEYPVPPKFWTDAQIQAQNFYQDCPNGWLTITDQNSVQETLPQSPRMVLNQPPKKAFPVDSFCALIIVDGMNPNQSIRVLQRAKPFRNGVTILLYDGSLPSERWLPLALKTKYAFFLAKMNGTDQGSISLICPFVEEHAADIEIKWVGTLGFFEDFMKTMANQCFHKFDGHWPMVFREVPPMVSRDPVFPGEVKGFEGDFVTLLRDRLNINTKFIQDNGTFPMLPNGQRIPSIIYPLYSYDARMIFGASPAHVNFYAFGDFSVNLYTSTAHYCTRYPQPLPNYQNLVKVFPLNVWLLMLLTNLICSVVMYGMYRFYASNEILTYPTIGSIRATFLDFLVRINLGIMEPDPISWFKTHSAGSFFSGVFYIYATFLGFFYTSMFLATLVSVERETPVNTASDALARGANVYIHKMLSMSRPDLESFQLLPKAVQEVGLMANRRGTVFDLGWDAVPAQGFEEMKTQGAAVVIGVSRTSSNYVVNSVWDGKYIGTEPIHAPWQIAVHFPKYAPWGPLINNMTMRMIDSGIMDRFSGRYTVMKMKSEDVFEAIRLDQLLAAFILLVGGSTLATIAFSLELQAKCCKSP